MDTEQEEFDEVMSTSEHLFAMECADEEINVYVNATIHSPVMPVEHHTLFSETIWDHLAGESAYGPINPESPYLIPGEIRSICSDVPLDGDCSPENGDPPLSEIDLYLECIDDPQYVMPEMPAVNTHSLIGQNLKWKVSFPASQTDSGGKISERLRCPECTRTFGTESQQKQHLVMKHGKSLKFDCQQCGFVTDSNRNLQRHVRRMHKGIGRTVSVTEKPYRGNNVGPGLHLSAAHLTRTPQPSSIDNNINILETETCLQNCKNDAILTADTSVLNNGAGHADNNRNMLSESGMPDCINELLPTSIAQDDPFVINNRASHEHRTSSVLEHNTCTSTALNASAVLSTLTTPFHACHEDIKKALDGQSLRQHLDLPVSTDLTVLNAYDVMVQTDQSDNAAPREHQNLVKNACMEPSNESDIGNDQIVDGVKSNNSCNSEKISSFKRDLSHPYRCSECQFTCRTKRDARLHGHKMQIEWQCHICQKPLGSNIALKKHRLRFHSGSSSPKAHECTYPNCERKFRLQCDLSEHMSNVHSATGKPFRCSHPGCTKTFKCPRSLRKHCCVHTNRWACPWRGCGKRFRDQYNLQVHQASHTGSKPNQCRYCNYKCVQKASMNWHLMKKHATETAERKPTLTQPRTVHVEIHVL